MVIRGAQEVPAEVGIPGKAVPFFLVTFQPQVRTALPAGIWNTETQLPSPSWCGYLQQEDGYDDPTWLNRVLCVVEDQHVRGGRLGGDDAGVLGHVAGSVHLSLVVDLDLDLYFPTH